MNTSWDARRRARAQRFAAGGEYADGKVIDPQQLKELP
jgi:hypothetical protein